MFRLSIILLFISSLATSAANVAGSLADSATRAPLANASVRLVVSDTVTKFFVTTDKKGKFEFEKTPPGTYRLYISFVGYATYSQTLDVKDKNIELERIYLAPLTITTESVEVIAEGPDGKQKGDTTEFNAAAYYTDRNAMLEELLKKIPGVEIDRDGNITIHGENAPNILIDGKPLFDSPKTALKNLPADVVKKIMIYDKQNEKSEFAGLSKGDETKKTINIVTKNNLSGGYFGSLKSVYSAWDRLDLSGNINAFDTAQKYSFYGGANNGSLSPGASAYIPPRANYSVGGSYSNVWAGKFDFTGNVGYDYYNSRDLNDTFREYLSLMTAGDSVRYFNQSNDAASGNSNFKLSSRIKYNMGINDEALFNLSGRWSKSDRNAKNISENLYTDGQMANFTKMNSSNNSDSKSISADLSYKRKFDSTDHSLAFSFSADVSDNDRAQSTVSNNLTSSGGMGMEFYQLQKTAEPSKSVGGEASATYTRPLSESLKIKLNYTAEYSRSESNKNVYSTDSIGFVFTTPDTSLSDGYRYSALTHKGGLQLDYKIGKLTLSANSYYRIAFHSDKRVFPYVGRLDYNYTAVLPFARADYKFDDKSNLRLTYWSSSSDPNFSQLNPKPNIDNPQYVYVGNPNLKNAYSNQIYLDYRSFNQETKSYIYSAIHYNVSTDQILSSSRIFKNDTTLFGNVHVLAGGTYTTPINLDGYKSVSVNFSYSFPWETFSTSKINLGVFGYMARNPGILNGEKYNSDFYTGGLMVGLSGDVDKTLEYSANARTSFSKSYNSAFRRWQYDNNMYSYARVKWTFAEFYFATMDYVGRARLSGTAATGNSDLLNLGVGAKLFGKSLELSLNAVDVFDSNNNENVSINDYYYDRTRSKLISRYFSLNLDYHLSSMEGGAAPPDERREPGRRVRF